MKIAVHCTVVKVQATNNPWHQGEAHIVTYPSDHSAGYYNRTEQNYVYYSADGFYLEGKNLVVFRKSENTTMNIAMYPEGYWFGVRIVEEEDEDI